MYGFNRQLKSPHLAALLAFLIFLLTFTVEAFSESKAGSIIWPTDFDFTSSIKEEGYSLEEFSQSYLNNIVYSQVEDTYGLALANLTLGLVKKDPYYIVIARSLFAANYEISKDPKEKRLSELSLKYAENILSGRYIGGQPAKDTVEPVEVKKYSPSKKDFRKIIIGKSAIRVNRNSKIKVQADRVTRDWLMAYNIKSSPWAFSIEHVAEWHEGQKIKELVDITGAKVFPVTGTIVKRFGWNWFAPDAEGTFRFEIAEDKVLFFPSTILIDDQTAIINDTHGINALAWDSLDADLVVGCGDSRGKMDAAYYLADRGVNVYVPTDRLIGTLIGTNTKGIIVGSAPVKETENGAIIGDQPIAFDVNEPVVVSHTEGRYPLQYYDTPYRYFKELERYIGKPMKIMPVDVVEYGKAGVVVDEARKVGAKLIGIRVKSKHEHDALYSWLKEDRGNRVVLFHTAVYPDGYRLFFEFPQQTSFGDIRPEFE
ncbi:MAG: hypothetical protein ACYS9T_02750 [Planctomycetota bacterium]|jgi:hypothetical protein